MPSRIQALTQAAGEALTAFCGTQMTRLSYAASPGDTVLRCERLAGWPQTGTVQVDGVVYAYGSRTDLALADLTVATPNGVLQGVQSAHLLGTAVVDASRSTSGLDLIRRAIFVDTALGDDLTILGRNLGVGRQAALTGDDHYRGIIKAMAYNPRGTVYGMELALDAMLGRGNYRIVENFAAFPATVEVNVSAATFLAQQAQGRAYVDGARQAVAQSAQQVDLSGRYLSVTGLHLEDDQLYVDCRAALPSAATQASPTGAVQAFQFVGNESQVSLVQLGVGAGATQITGAPGYYMHQANVQPAGTAYASCVFGIPPNTALSATDARGFALRLCDGAYSIGVGCVASGSKVGIGLCDATGAGTGALVAGVVATFAKGSVVDVAVEKIGRTTVNLRLNGKLVQTCALTAFPSVTTPTFDFGALGQQAANACVRFVGLHTHTPTDYMGSQGYRTAAMSGTHLTDGTAAFQPTDVARPVRVYGGTAKNSAGGLNNGRFLAAYHDGTRLDLRGVPQPGTGQVFAGKATLTVSGHNDAFTYPDDLGKTVTLYNSAVGNAGTYTVAAILQNGTGASFASLQSPFTATAHTCVLAGAAFAAETGLSWQLNPAGITETGLSYDMAGTAAVTVTPDGNTAITPQRPLVAPLATYRAQASVAYSGIIVDTDLPVVSRTAEGPPPQFSVAPAYASDTSNFAKVYLADLLAAGIQLRFNYV